MNGSSPNSKGSSARHTRGVIFIKCAKDGSISESRHGIGPSYVRVGSVRASQLLSNFVWSCLSASQHEVRIVPPFAGDCKTDRAVRASGVRSSPAWKGAALHHLISEWSLERAGKVSVLNGGRGRELGGTWADRNWVRAISLDCHNWDT